jgi:Gpi18-like mannosyltransferase
MTNAELEAAELRARNWPSLDFSFVLSGIWPLLLLGLIFRLMLQTLPDFESDIDLFQFWANSLAENHPWNFYDQDFFTDYAPGYMYVLWFIGELHQLLNFTDAQYEYILKLPATIADLASVYLLWRFLEGQSPLTRYVAAGIYLVFPPALMIGPVWGQVDSILAFFLLLSIYFISRDRPVAGAAAYTVGFLVKPQAIAALPFLAFWIMRRNRPQLGGPGGIRVPRVWLECLAVGLGLVVVLIIPFFTYKPWELIDQLYSATDVENYRTNSFWAYNFWGVVNGLEGLPGNFFDALRSGGFPFIPDNQTFMGIEYRNWGLALTVGALAAIIPIIGRGEDDRTDLLALGTALSIMAFYVFLTRMHERYIFPMFLPMLAACALSHSRALWAMFVLLVVVHSLNLYYVYSYYRIVFTQTAGVIDQPAWPALFNWVEDRAFLLSLLTAISFPVLLAIAYGLTGRRPPKPEGA